MNNLEFTTQGIKGGKHSKPQKSGFMVVNLRHNLDFITFDDFSGSGETYQQRELTLIEVYENDKLLFSGDKYELFEILKGK